MNKSVQQLMDEKMCRPGYQWNETLQRCLGMGGGDGEVTPPEESIAPEPAPAEGANTGRGAKRVNAQGVKQVGTSMGTTLPMQTEQVIKLSTIVVDICRKIVSLEQIQGLNNSRSVLGGNSSASNEAFQQKHDANDLLIKGAGLAGAGRELGLSEEETLAAVSRQFRRQQTRDAIGARRSDRAQRESSWAQKQASLGNWGDGELQGVGFDDMSEEERAFGLSQDELQTYRPDDRGYTEDEDTGLIRSESFAETKGDYRGTRKEYRREGGKTIRTDTREPIYGTPATVAPVSAMRDALMQLEAGPGQFGYDAFPGSADVAGRLEADVEPDRGADAALGAETVRRDSRRFDDETREANDWRARAQAELIARDSYTVNGPGAMADEAIGRIGEIRKIGPALSAAKKPGPDPVGSVQVIREGSDPVMAEVLRRGDGVNLDPVTGDPVAIQGPELPVTRPGDIPVNNAGSANSLNAPQSAMEWINQTRPEFRESSTSFGNYPQVDITLQTTNFANRLRELQGYGMEGVSANIRSVDELQRVVAAVGSKAQAKGQQLFRFDPETGKNIPSSTAGPSEVMNLMRMSPGEQQQFANAMYQMEAARRSSVNENPTGIYLSRMTKQGPQQMGTADVAFDAAEAVGGGLTRIARQNKGSSIRIGTTDQGKPVKQDINAALAALPSRDAQEPYIGQVAGQKPRVNRRKPANMGSGDELQANIQRQAESRAKGKPVDQQRVDSNITKARLAEERESRDSRKREEQRDLIRSFTPANLRQRGRYS